MPARPFRTRTIGVPPMQALVGSSPASGLRRTADGAMAETRGCTHLRDLVLAVAIIADQTISSWREPFMPELRPPKGKVGERPFFLNQCVSWGEQSYVAAVHFSEFHRKPRARRGGPEALAGLAPHGLNRHLQLGTQRAEGEVEVELNHLRS